MLFIHHFQMGSPPRDRFNQLAYHQFLIVMICLILVISFEVAVKTLSAIRSNIRLICLLLRQNRSFYHNMCSFEINSICLSFCLLPFTPKPLHRFRCILVQRQIGQEEKATGVTFQGNETLCRSISTRPKLQKKLVFSKNT